MKHLLNFLIVIIIAGVLAIFRIFAWESLWNWLVHESGKEEVQEVADLAGKFAPALGTILIGFVGSCIAWRQSKTAREKLRLDLFEKRHKVADSVAKFFRNFHGTSTVTNSLASDISNAFYSGEFLFGHDFKQAMQELVHDTETLKTLQIACDSSPQGSPFHQERDALKAKLHDVWPPRMWKLFAKYLHFPNVV